MVDAAMSDSESSDFLFLSGLLYFLLLLYIFLKNIVLWMMKMKWERMSKFDVVSYQIREGIFK